MSVVKRVWASVQGDPVFMRRVNGWLTILWLVMIPISIATGWVRSVVYVSALSAWQAARVEVNQAAEQEAHQQEDLPGEIVNRVIDETDVKASPSGAA